MDKIINQFGDAWNMIVGKLSGWIESAIQLLPNIVLALIVMVITWLVVRYVQKYALKIMGRLSKNHAANRVLASVFAALFVLLMLMIVLDILHLDKALASLLAGAGVIGLAIGLALQEPLINLFSGFMMSFRDPFNIGDLVETNGYFGTIKEISLRATILTLPTGELVTIPNKLVIQNPFKNYSITGERKVEFQCGVAYDSDLEKVQETTVQTLSSLCTSGKENIDFFYTQFGDSSISFTVRFLLGKCTNADYLKTKSQAIIALKKAFDNEGIVIPFPIRTLELKDNNIRVRQLQPKQISDN
jgi:small conductance mechanosensitive channel